MSQRSRVSKPSLISVSIRVTAVLSYGRSIPSYVNIRLTMFSPIIPNLIKHELASEKQYCSASFPKFANTGKSLLKKSKFDFMLHSSLSYNTLSQQVLMPKLPIIHNYENIISQISKFCNILGCGTHSEILYSHELFTTIFQALIHYKKG